MSSENPIPPAPPPPATSPAAVAPAQAPPPTPAPSYAVPPPIIERKSGFLAGFLSILPGLGHLYLGAYQRALIIFGGFVFSIVLTSNWSGFFGFAIAFVWFFGVVDSVRLARAINLGLASETDAEWDKQVKRVSSGTASLTFGVILVGLGALWLIDRYTNIDWSFMHQWGCATAFILLGLVLIVSHMVKKRREHEQGIGMPPRSN